MDFEKDELEVHPKFIDTHAWDGSYPRHALVSFLPVEAAAAGAPAVDPRLPRDPRVLPYRVMYVSDDRGENFTVSYRQPQVCNDGVTRKTIWHRRNTGLPRSPSSACRAQEGRRLSLGPR